MYPVNKDLFKSVFSHCKEPEKFCNLLDNVLAPNGIDTKERVSMFLAQCGHESGGFTITSENMNYSAKGLMSVFHKYFPDEDTANKYAHNPAKIGNKVYANRMGNGDEASGDGYRYHGRGYIQLTGKDNYRACGQAIGEDLVSNPDLVSSDKTIALKSAIWFWNKNNLNHFADAKDILGATKKINGGTIGLEERTSNYHKLMA